MRASIVTSALAAAASVLAAAVPGATAQSTFDTCHANVKFTSKPKPKSMKPLYAGQKFKVSFKVKPLGSTRRNPISGGVRIALPPDVCVLATSPRGAEVQTDNGLVFWPDVLLSKKKKKQEFSITARIKTTYTEPNLHTDGLLCVRAPSRNRMDVYMGSCIHTLSL